MKWAETKRKAKWETENITSISTAFQFLVPKAQLLPFSSLSFLICLFSKFSLFYLSELTLFLSWNQKILPSNRELGWEDFRPRQSMKKSTEVQKVGCLKNEKEYGPSLV